MMDKQVLTSHPAGTDADRYAVGYLKQGKLTEVNNNNFNMTSI